MEKFKNSLLYRGFHCNDNGDKTIVVDGMKLQGYWVIGYLHMTNGLAFITPYTLKVTYVPKHSTLMSPAVAVIKDTVCICTGVYDDNDDGTPALIFQNDIVVYNDGFHYFKGRVCFEGGAFGIGCESTIPIESHSDNFISFYEMIFNQEVWDDFNQVQNVTVLGNMWEVDVNA